MKASKQISESLPIMILLTLSGGFMDAYSYLCRGEVFANAQTGNILLFGVNLSMGHWSKALQYVRNVYTAGTEFACKQSYIACVRCTG